MQGSILDSANMVAETPKGQGLLFLLLLWRRKRKRLWKRRKTKRFWVRDIFKERRIQGDSYNLVDRRSYDLEFYFTLVPFWFCLYYIVNSLHSVTHSVPNVRKLFIKINCSLDNFVQMLRRWGIWNECFNWPDIARRSKFPSSYAVFPFHTANASTSMSTRKGKILILVLGLVLMLTSRPFSQCIVLLVKTRLYYASVLWYSTLF